MARKRRGQDEFTRARRVADGCCPTHGVALMQDGILYNSVGYPVGDTVECPRNDCDYKQVPVRPGTILWKALQRIAVA